MIKIAFISTGGTISMQSNSEGLATPKAGAKELIDEIKNYRDGIIIEDIEFRKIPSAHMTISDLLDLRKKIIEISEKKYDGIVITHGTDTMEETAYFLDLTLQLEIPIVLTGSQRPLSALGTDAQVNIIDSIMVASDSKAKDMGVLIVFSSEIIPAREATKIHRTRLDTFKSLEFGPIGTVDNGKVLWFRKPMISDTYDLGNIKDISVDIIPCYLGSDSRLIKNSINDDVNGIVLQALGAGHVPEATLDGIAEAIKYSVPVILASRPYMGRFFTNTYGFKGSEKYLRKMGVIFGEDLTPQKIRIKLMVLLSLGYNYNKIKNEFEKNFYEND